MEKIGRDHEQSWPIAKKFGLLGSYCCAVLFLCFKIYTNLFRSSRKSPSKDKSNVPDNNFSEVIDFCCCSLGWFLVSGLDAMMSSESPILSVVQLGARWLLSRLLRGAGCWEESAVLPRPEQNVILVQPSQHQQRGYPETPV